MIEVRLPQLLELAHKVDELRYAIARLSKKLDALTPAAAAPGPVQINLPLTEPPEPALDESKPVKTKRARRTAEEAKPAPHVTGDNGHATETVNGNGKSHEDDDEATQRARVSFEAKRVQRTLGVGGMRAAIRKVAGAHILQIDDVPAQQLATLLSELQAM